PFPPPGVPIPRLAAHDHANLVEFVKDLVVPDIDGDHVHAGAFLAQGAGDGLRDPGIVFAVDGDQRPIARRRGPVPNESRRGPTALRLGRDEPRHAEDPVQTDGGQPVPAIIFQQARPVPRIPVIMAMPAAFTHGWTSSGCSRWRSLVAEAESSQ